MLDFKNEISKTKVPNLLLRVQSKEIVGISPAFTNSLGFGGEFAMDLRNIQYSTVNPYFGLRSVSKKWLLMIL